MKLSKLLTYTFDKNVGPKDRIFRILSDAALAAAPWVLDLGLSQSWQIGLTIGGVAWLATGILLRCGAYYSCGISTHKAHGR